MLGVKCVCFVVVVNVGLVMNMLIGVIRLVGKGWCSSLVLVLSCVGLGLLNSRVKLLLLFCMWIGWLLVFSDSVWNCMDWLLMVWSVVVFGMFIVLV